MASADTSHDGTLTEDVSLSDEPQLINIPFDKFFRALRRVAGGTVFMAMPLGADLSTVRTIADTLLPAGIEVIVDEEVVFLYAHLEDFDVAAFQALSGYQQRFIAEAIARYHVTLRAFLSIYTCRAYRLWEWMESRTADNTEQRCR